MQTTTTVETVYESTKPLLESEQDYISNIENARSTFGDNTDEYYDAVELYLSYLWENDPDRFEEEQAKYYASPGSDFEADENEIVAQTELEFEDFLARISSEKGEDSDEYKNAFGEYLDFLYCNDMDKFNVLEAQWTEQQEKELMAQQEVEIAAYEVPLTWENFSAYFTCKDYPVYDTNGILVNTRYKVVPTEEYYDKICTEKEFSFRIVYDYP